MQLSSEAKGKTLEDYVEKHQDRSRNALQKSHEAAYNAWVEELRADQVQFVSDKILRLVSELFFQEVAQFRHKHHHRHKL